MRLLIQSFVAASAGFFVAVFLVFVFPNAIAALSRGEFFAPTFLICSVYSLSSLAVSVFLPVQFAGVRLKWLLTGGLATGLWIVGKFLSDWQSWVHTRWDGYAVMA